MTPNEVKEAFKQKCSLRHKDSPTAYVILNIGQMKTEGKWHHSCTYMNVKTKEPFTRKLNEMGSFKAPKLK